MEEKLFRSTSCIWGSGTSHLDEDGRRQLEVDVISVPESRLSIDVHVERARLTGSRRVVCHSENESKALNLNRAAQCKLEEYKEQMNREKRLSEMRYIQNRRIFRARSARMLHQQTNNLYHNQMPLPGHRVRPFSEKLGMANLELPNLKNRPKSWPESRMVRKEAPQTSIECAMCRKLQSVIWMYEREGKKAGLMKETKMHSMCLFSDVQVRSFIEMLENEYLAEVPNLTSLLHESGNLPISAHASHNQRHDDIRSEASHNTLGLNPKQPIEERIKKFCKRLDLYNKKNRYVSDSLKHQMDLVRLKQAMLVKRRPSQGTLLKEEIQRKLGIK